MFAATAALALLGILAAIGSSGLTALALFFSAALCGSVGAFAGRSERDFDRAARAKTSEVRLLEERLEERKKIVDELGDGLDAALFICDARGVVLYANPPVQRLFGPEATRGQTLLATTLSVELEELMNQAIALDEPGRKEIVFTYPREWIGFASAWREPMQDRVFVSVYEITDLRRLERARKDFVANVSHELRTPMTIIRNYAETLLDENPPTAETAERVLPIVIAEVDRLSDLTQDLLSLSVAESEPVKKGDCDLADIVQGVVERLGEKASSKGLALDYEGPDSLPMQANGAQMTQIAVNLVDNALNYTTRGSVRVELRQEDGKAVFLVHDTGIGIATEHLDRIFERFYRVDRGRSRATGGTGLGLSIVRHIAEAHGGTATVDSALHRGSTFRVELPLG